jgi:hypothetical protein
LTKYERAFPPIALTHILESAKLKNEGRYQNESSWEVEPSAGFLDCVLEGANSKNLKEIIVVVVCNGGGLGKEDIVNCFLSFGAGKFAHNHVYNVC